MRTVVIVAWLLLPACAERHHVGATRVHLHEHSAFCAVGPDGAAPCPMAGVFASGKVTAAGFVLVAEKDVAAGEVRSRIDCYRAPANLAIVKEQSRASCPFALAPLEVDITDSEGVVIAVVRSQDQAVLAAFAERVKALPGEWEL